MLTSDCLLSHLFIINFGKYFYIYIVLALTLQPSIATAVHQTQWKLIYNLRSHEYFAYKIFRIFHSTVKRVAEIQHSLNTQILPQFFR